MGTTEQRKRSAYARDMVGDRIAVVTEKRGKKTSVSGVVVGVESGQGVIVDGNGRTWPPVRFGIRSDDGRLHWTDSFADKGAAAGAAS